ncbi:MAG: class II fumarate hydratase [Acidobacteria bacterium]|nr:class II fumarate hydratase [Acidobacteriota bacterium]
MNFRIETDSMGQVKVPRDALYGAQTQRAVENFPISGIRIPRAMIRALGLLKKACARVNLDRGDLTPEIGDAIIQAASEVAEGRHDDQFVVDIFQTGSGTSSNMNANEVIANRAIQILGGEIGSKQPVHPNDQVNRGQSSNDIIPTAIHLAVLESWDLRLLPPMRELEKALDGKAKEFDDVIKIGRTHLQDAVPIRLGQEFSGYARQVGKAVERLEMARPHLAELALGGTAVGTGLNAPAGFAERVIGILSEETGLPLRQSANLFEALGSKDALVGASGALRGAAIALMKVADDIRWLASGPRCGLGEIFLPELQPGSSIMPGKVNPVIPEMILMVGAQVQGNDLALAIAGQGGHFELNTMMPVMVHNMVQAIDILGSGAQVFADRCVRGIRADRERCREMLEKSLAMVTALAPVIGYDAAASIAKQAYETGRTVREVAREKKVLSEKELDKLLEPRRMTGK